MTVPFEDGFGDSFVGRSDDQGAAKPHLVILVKMFQNKLRNSSKKVQQTTHEAPEFDNIFGRIVLDDVLFKTEWA